MDGEGVRWGRGDEGVVNGDERLDAGDAEDWKRERADRRPETGPGMR